MVNWKDIGVPIIVALIAGVVALVSALINYIIAALFVPNIEITRESNQTENKGAIEISNVGSAPAKGLKLTVNAPAIATFKEPLFSTERYTYNVTTDPPGLEIYVPRFVHGSGSVIRIETLISPSGNATSGDYIVYATHDQGSIRKSIPIFDRPTAPLTFPEHFSTFWNQWGSTITYGYIGLFIIAFALGYLRKKLTKKKMHH